MAQQRERRTIGRLVPRGSPTRLRRTGLRNPVVYVLLLAGLGDGITGNPIDALLLLGVGVALARHTEAPSDVASDGGSARPRSWIPIAIATGLAYALLVAGFERATWQMTPAVLVPGAVGIWLAWREPMRPEPQALAPLGARLWTWLFVGLGLFELFNLVMQPSLLEGSFDHPTLSVLSDPALSTYPGRAAAMFVWLALGWYLAER